MPPRWSVLDSRERDNQMHMRRLGRTGLLASEVGLGGAWLLGRRGELPVESGVATVRRALSLGINYVDTAECYIGGRSESVVGAALAGTHGACLVATKFGHVPPAFDFSRAAVIASAKASLQRLGRDSVDLFQLHTPPELPIESIAGPGGALDGMEELRQRGWCRYLGITGRDVEFLRRCLETDAFDTMLVFQRYDLLDQSAAPLLADARAHDVGVILGSPLKMGLFGSARAEMLPHLTPEDQQRVMALEALFAVEPGGVTAGAVRFALAPSEVSVVLSGAASPEEIEGAVAAAATPLPFELLEAVRRIAVGP